MPRNNSKVKIRNAYGEILKDVQLKNFAGDTIQSKPLGLADKKRTPRPSKYATKNTSTPGTIALTNNSFGPDWLNVFGSSACKTPLSPILIDGNNMCFGENQNNLPSKKLSEAEKVNEEVKAKKVMVRRRTSGMRRLFTLVGDNGEENHNSECIDRQHKVQLHRTPLKPISVGKENVLNKTPPDNIPRVRTHHTDENSLVRNLRNDWTSSILSETLLKTPQSPKDVNKKQPRVEVRRHLSPLFECTSGENSFTRQKNKKSIGDENYSSSEEFQKDDDKDNCSLKKAPTWRSLHSKVMDSTSTSSSMIPLRRSRRRTELTDMRPSDQNNISQDNDPRCNGNLSSKKNASVLVDTGKPASQDESALVDKCQTDIRSRLPRVKIKRLNLDLGLCKIVSKGGASVREIANGNSTKSSTQSDHQATEQESNDVGDVLCGMAPNDVCLSKVPDENNLAKLGRTKGARRCVSKSKGNTESQPNILSCVNVPRVRLRKFRKDCGQIQNVPLTGALRKCSQVEVRTSRIFKRHTTPPEVLQEIQSVDNVPLGNHESQSSLADLVKERRKDPNSRANILQGKRLLRPRLRRLKLHSEKYHHAPRIADVENDSCSRMIEELPPEPASFQDQQAINTDPPKTHEPEVNTENIFDEDFSALLCPTTTSKEIERPTSSPTYDGVDHNMSTDSNCTRRKFYTSRICAAPVEPEPIKKPNIKSPVKTSKKNENIYDFFSQSSSEEMIPVDDIIQKMITMGKAVVFKHNKPKRRGVVKRKRNKKELLAKADKAVADKPKRLKTTNQPQPKSQAVLPTVVFEDRDEPPFNDDDVPDNASKNPKLWQEQSSFSGLARSTMIRQAKANVKTPSRKMITDRRQLLLMAKKIVGQSTPVKPTTNQPTAETTNVNQLSPIYGNKSPWRATDDHLPTTFYFGRNTGNLPSFSSDHIPSTQTENRPKSVSSFSSNDSDMENIAPVGVKENLQFDAQSVPRRGPSNRSPLKSIKIIDVVKLPPLVLDNTAKETDKDKDGSILGPVDKSASCRNQTVQDESRDKVDLFGFEEIIDEEDSLEASLNITAIPTRDDLKEKLHRLKRLKPEIPPTGATKPETNKDVYDGPKMRQRSLRHMLCSTMIEKPKSVKKDVIGEKCDDFFKDDCNGDLSNLFKDPDPETTFNQSDTRRTYSRLYKTKRRKVRNNFVMFMDSDASDDGEENDLVYRPKKRHKNEANTNAKELDKFATEFNEMCKEVSQYQLIVE